MLRCCTQGAGVVALFFFVTSSAVWRKAVGEVFRTVLLCHLMALALCSNILFGFFPVSAFQACSMYYSNTYLLLTSLYLGLISGRSNHNDTIQIKAG